MTSKISKNLENLDTTKLKNHIIILIFPQISGPPLKNFESNNIPNIENHDYDQHFSFRHVIKNIIDAIPSFV